MYSLRFALCGFQRAGAFTTEYLPHSRKGDDSGGDTPLPIPNREVKPASADGTAGETPWESRSSPISHSVAHSSVQPNSLVILSLGVGETRYLGRILASEGTTTANGATDGSEDRSALGRPERGICARRGRAVRQRVGARLPGGGDRCADDLVSFVNHQTYPAHTFCRLPTGIAIKRSIRLESCGVANQRQVMGAVRYPRSVAIHKGWYWVNDPVEGGSDKGLELDRVAFFSDGVFAIAITLLVLEIRLPEPAPGSHPNRSGALLEELWPDFYSFLISFWFVGTLWIAHHRVFHYIRDYDRRLLLINLFFLMWIVLLPFSSTLLSRYEDQQAAVIIYAAHVAVAELALAWVWRHASRTPHLMEARLMDARQRKYNELLVVALPLVFALSIVVSFISALAAELSWLLVFLVRPVLLRITHYSGAYDR